LCNVLDLAVEDTAEIVDCCCIQRLVFPKLINGCTGNMMMCNERICCFGGILQCLPEWTIVDHNITASHLWTVHLDTDIGSSVDWCEHVLDTGWNCSGSAWFDIRSGKATGYT